MRIRSIACAIFLVASQGLTQDAWGKVEPKDFHGTWEIALDRIEWKRALAGLPQKWRAEAKTDIAKDVGKDQPVMTFSEKRVAFVGKKRGKSGGEAEWQQLDPTTVQLWVKGQSSPMKLRRQAGKHYMIRRGLELPLRARGSTKRTAKKTLVSKPAYPDPYASWIKRAGMGDLDAIARLIDLGRWNDVGAVRPGAIRSAAKGRESYRGLSARQIFGCVLANYAVRHKADYGKDYNATMLEARRLLDSAPTNHPMLALDLAWLLRDYAPKDGDRARMLKSWALSRIKAAGVEQDTLSVASWWDSVAKSRQRERSWDSAYPAFERAAKLYVKANDPRSELAALRNQAICMGHQSGVKRVNQRDAQASQLLLSVQTRERGWKDWEGMARTTLALARLASQPRFFVANRMKSEDDILTLWKATREIWRVQKADQMEWTTMAEQAAVCGMLSKQNYDLSKSSSGETAKRRLQRAAALADLAAKGWDELRRVLPSGRADQRRAAANSSSWKAQADRLRGSRGGNSTTLSNIVGSHQPGRSPANGLPAPKWSIDYSQTLRKAKAQDKIVLVNFSGSDWCGWCVKLKSEVFDTAEFKNWAAKNALLFQADFPKRLYQSSGTKKQNKGLSSKFGIRGYPTILVLDSAGKEIGRLGYVKGGPDKWLAKLKTILAKK